MDQRVVQIRKAMVRQGYLAAAEHFAERATYEYPSWYVDRLLGFWGL